LIVRHPRATPALFLLLQPLRQISSLDIKKAWATEYQGDAPRQLLNIVLNERKGDVAYCNSALILQSSGYGKSRALEELEKLVTTMPMNICSVKGVDGSTFVSHLVFVKLHLYLTSPVLLW